MKVLLQFRRLSKLAARKLQNGGKTAHGVWGEAQMRKLQNLGQNLVVMQMG